MPRLSAFAVLLFSALLLFSCDENDQFEPDYSQVPDEPDVSDIEPHITRGGVEIYIIEEGDGFEVAERDVLAARFTMRSEDGTIHDSTWEGGRTGTQNINMQEIIDGVFEGVLDLRENGERINPMREGGERLLVIPSELGYDGSGGELEGETLRFHIELDHIID